ncbi:radical SAM protein [bacterium]|nr:radical SAM protein [bacterium]
MKFNSCHWITHGLNFEPAHIEMCCLRCHVGGGNLIVKHGYNGEILDWEEFFKLKQPFIEENKQGKINPKCEGCFNLSKADWKEEEHYFNYIHFNHWTHCNCNCIYCFTDHNKQFFNTSRYYNVLPVVKDMFEKKLFRPGGEITFAGGEPTILDEFEDLLNLLIENKVPRIIIHTSGIKYSPAIARGVNAGVVDVVVSLDAGSSETFKKIKNVNAYKRVVRNVKKYAEAEDKKNLPLVATKYILMPKLNDNIEEAEKWLTMTYESGVRSIVLDIEHEWFCLQREKKAFPQYCRDVLYYIHEKADSLGIQVTLYNSARYFINNEKDFPNYDFIPYHYESLGKFKAKNAKKVSN